MTRSWEAAWTRLRIALPLSINVPCGEESRKPGLITIRRPVTRRPQFLSDPLTWPETQERVKALFKRGLQQDGEFEKAWPAVLGTLLDETWSRYSVAMLGELQLVEKKINGCNPAVPGNDEITTSVHWRAARAPRHP